MSYLAKCKVIGRELLDLGRVVASLTEPQHDGFVLSDGSRGEGDPRRKMETSPNAKRT